MKNYLLRTVIPVLLLVACGQKEKDEPGENFFPALSFIRSQVAHVDTSLYSIIKIVYLDSTHSDTSYHRREEFRGLAKDFLDLPDLAEKKYRKRFREDKMYDEVMNRVLLSYQPINAEKEEIQKQEVLITPNTAVGDKINSIIIEKIISNKDGYLKKHLLWRADKSFQVVIMEQKPGQAETTSTFKVSWNEASEQ